MTQAKENNRMTETRKALVVRGGWEGHRPVQATELFLPFLTDQGYAVRIEESTEVYADAAEMAGTDLVVQCISMSEISGPEVAGLRAAVEAGTGFTGWHGGIADSFRASADYLQLVGGQFVNHPGKEPELRQGGQEDNYLPYTVVMTPLGREHPITAGLPDFELETEQYWVLHDDLIDVLATTTHPARSWQPWHRPVVSPAVWTRRWGAGRVVVTTPGHSLDVLENPSVRTIIERGMLWASRTASAS
jgi:type 1 glutamine amidotransferase